jgi:hypothetical protein
MLALLKGIRMVDGRREMSWQDHQPKANYGPPIDVLPGYMDSIHILARTDDIAIAVGGFRVWQVGFMFTLSVRLSPKGFAKLDDISSTNFDALRPGEPSVFLEMRWPDGRSVSNTKPGRAGASRTFGIQRGGGSGPRWDLDWWVSPLPRPPAITLACTWPAANLSEAIVEVPEQELRQAASRQMKLWG